MNGRLGEREIAPAPISLPRLALLEREDVKETAEKETAERIATTRILRAGRDAWEAVQKSGSFENWEKVAVALAQGRDHSLRVSGANRPAGQTYCRAMNHWCAEHGFAAMAKSLRSNAIEMHNHIDDIRAWRDSLPQRQRQRLNDPLAVTRRWRAATQSNGKCPADLKREAMAAWRRFVSCVRALPPNDAVPLWRMALAETLRCNQLRNALEFPQMKL
jgi:hypothetical protein